MKKKLTKPHFLKWRKGDSPEMIPQKCSCGGGIAVLCDKLFTEMIKPCMRVCCTLKAKKNNNH